MEFVIFVCSIYQGHIHVLLWRRGNGTSANGEIFKIGPHFVSYPKRMGNLYTEDSLE